MLHCLVCLSREEKEDSAREAHCARRCRTQTLGLRSCSVKRRLCGLCWCYCGGRCCSGQGTDDRGGQPRGDHAIHASAKVCALFICCTPAHVRLLVVVQACWRGCVCRVLCKSGGRQRSQRASRNRYKSLSCFPFLRCADSAWLRCRCGDTMRGGPPARMRASSSSSSCSGAQAAEPAASGFALCIGSKHCCCCLAVWC